MAQLPERESTTTNTSEPAAPTIDLSAILPYLNLPITRLRLGSANTPKQEATPSIAQPQKTEEQPTQQAQQSQPPPLFLRGIPLIGLNLNGLLPQPNNQEPAKPTPEPPKPPVVRAMPLPLRHPLSPDPRRMPPPPHFIQPSPYDMSTQAIQRRGWVPNAGPMGTPRGWVWGNSPESMNAGPMTPRVYRHDDLNAPMGALREAAPGSINPHGIRIGSPWSNRGGR